MTPFWGSPTSSVDWCEANYAVSPYVCEWFNTISSGAMLAAGVGGAVLHGRRAGDRFLVAFVLLALVGAGSVAFHATLRFGTQMLDELPMVYLALALVFILVEHGAARRFGALFPVTLGAYGVAVSAAALRTRGVVEFFVFNGSFSALEIGCILLLRAFHRRTLSDDARRWVRRGVTLYLAGIAAWFVDIRFCGFVSTFLPRHGLVNPQLHAVWHVLASAGLYDVLVALACDRLQTTGRTPTVRRRFGLLPYAAPSAATTTRL